MHNVLAAVPHIILSVFSLISFLCEQSSVRKSVNGWKTKTTERDREKAREIKINCQKISLMILSNLLLIFTFNYIFDLYTFFGLMFESTFLTLYIMFYLYMFYLLKNYSSPFSPFSYVLEIKLLFGFSCIF